MWNYFRQLRKSQKVRKALSPLMVVITLIGTAIGIAIGTIVVGKFFDATSDKLTGQANETLWGVFATIFDVPDLSGIMLYALVGGAVLSIFIGAFVYTRGRGGGGV